MTEERDHKTEAVRVLLAHGFLPDKGNECWNKKGKMFCAEAYFDMVTPTMTISMQRIDDEEVIISTVLDVSSCDEDLLQRAVQPFDVI